MLKSWPKIMTVLFHFNDKTVIYTVTLQKRAPKCPESKSFWLLEIYLINRGAATDFMADHQEGFLIRGVFGGDKYQTFRS